MSVSNLILAPEPERDDFTTAGVLLHPDQEEGSTDDIEIPENQSIVAETLSELDRRVEKYGSIAAYETREKSNSWRKAGTPPGQQLEVERSYRGIDESDFESVYSNIRESAIEEGISIDKVRLETLNPGINEYGFKVSLEFKDSSERDERSIATHHLNYDLDGGELTSSWSYRGNSSMLKQVKR
jgi:hypothetical protein